MELIQKLLHGPTECSAMTRKKDPVYLSNNIEEK